MSLKLVNIIVNIITSLMPSILRLTYILFHTSVRPPGARVPAATTLLVADNWDQGCTVRVRVRVGTGPNLSQSRTRPDFENTSVARPDRDRSGLLKLWDPTRPSKIPLIPETDRNPTELPCFGPRFLYVMWGTLETLVIMIVSYYILHWNISKVLVQTFAMYH